MWLYVFLKTHSGASSVLNRLVRGTHLSFAVVPQFQRATKSAQITMKQWRTNNNHVMENRITGWGCFFFIVFYCHLLVKTCQSKQEPQHSLVQRSSQDVLPIGRKLYKWHRRVVIIWRNKIRFKTFCHWCIFKNFQYFDELSFGSPLKRSNIGWSGLLNVRICYFSVHVWQETGLGFVRWKVEGIRRQNFGI